MATLRMSELATADLARSDAFQRKQALRKPAPTRTDRVEAGARVLRVLVVDAKQESANALVRQARYAGRGAHAAPDGVAALRVAASPHPDVVLLDMETLSMDGCQVAKHLRSAHVSDVCLIIAVTDRADDAHRKLCMEAGIDLLLIKPVDPEVVETLLMLECVRVNRRRAREAVNKLKRCGRCPNRGSYRVNCEANRRYCKR